MKVLIVFGLLISSWFLIFLFIIVWLEKDLDHAWDTFENFAEAILESK